jgi:hypothetical protein
VPAVRVEKREAVHHPRVQPICGVLGNLRDDVQPISQPAQLAARGGWKDRRRAVLAAVTVLRYVLAIVSETSCRVVW